jgi:hypothetical protein
MNKFLILIAAFLFIFKVSDAQTEKGNQTLGVNLGFSFNQYANNVTNFEQTSDVTFNGKITTFSIGPNYSFFIADKLDLGTTLSYMALTDKTGNNDGNNNLNGPVKQTNNTFDGKIFLRKYFLYANKIGIRTGPFIGYSRNVQKVTWDAADAASNSNDVSHAIEAGVNLDLVYYPSHRLGVAATLANLEYDHFTEKRTYNITTENNKGNNVNFNFINNGLTLSVFYVFGSKG